MNLRGASHIEMILSFIIFAAVVGFALYFFNPVQTDRIVDTSLSYAFREIEKNTSVKVLIYSVIMNNNQLPLNSEVVAFDVEGVNENFGILGENSNGDLFEGRKEGSLFFLRAPNSVWMRTNLTYLKFSEDFEDSNFAASAVFNSNLYEVSTSRTEQVVSEKRFLELNRSYYLDYAGLKRYFNLPDRVNFGFSLILEDLEIISEQNLPSGWTVYSDSKRIQVLRNDGKNEYAQLVVRVW